MALPALAPLLDQLDLVAVEEVRRKGGKVVREAGPMKHGTTVIAFVTDPDGYKIELIEKRR